MLINIIIFILYIITCLTMAYLYTFFRNGTYKIKQTSYLKA